MNNSLNNQPFSKPDPQGKAITSLILSIVSTGIGGTILASIFFLPLLMDRISMNLIELYFMLMFFAFPGGLVFGILGLIFGIIGLKSTKKNLAPVGIVLSIIGLVLLIYIFFIYYTYYIYIK